MIRFRLAVALVAACVLVTVLAAQTVPVPDKPGRYLLTRQLAIPGDSAPAQLREAAGQATPDTWWIATGNITGDLRRVTTFTFYESYASFEKSLLASRGGDALAMKGNASLAALRDDLSFNPDKLPPSAARYWAVTTMYLKAGHLSDFAERTKIEIDLLKKAGLDHQFLVYQVLVGVPSSGAVFYVITPIKALADMDVDDSAKAAPVFTEEVRRRLETLNQQMISGIESDVLMVRPDLSRPPASYVAADPAFWTPKQTRK